MKKKSAAKAAAASSKPTSAAAVQPPGRSVNELDQLDQLQSVNEYPDLSVKHWPEEVPNGER